MEKYFCKNICSGIAVGTIYYYGKSDLPLNKSLSSDSEAEWTRFQAAREIAKTQILELYKKTLSEVGKKEAAIFDVHQMLLYDNEYSSYIEKKIKHENLVAEYAVSEVISMYTSMYEKFDDVYMKERVADIQDISNRVIQILSGANNDMANIKEPVIIAATELSPSELISLDKSKVKGIILENGSEYSHVAVLVRTMNIPAAYGVNVDVLWHGKMSVLDADTEQLVVDPSEDVLLYAEKKLREQERYRDSLKKYVDLETLTKDGRKIDLFANISSVEDADVAFECGAEGIGLFRSEFLYLEKKEYPSEDEQYMSYKAVAEKFKGKKVRIRTLDIGAEKQAEYFDLEKEENPTLGFRAIRISLTNENIFKTQLRALLRANVIGNISVILPMIISLDEVRRVKTIYEDCKRQLKHEGIKYKDVEIGVMIETPAAVMISDELAKEVDFFSIGTNDLSQYTLAIDRQNSKLNSFFDAHHPAILKFINMTIDNGHAAGIKVGICGEIASDLSLTKTFVAMGVDELSVAPASVLHVREEIVK